VTYLLDRARTVLTIHDCESLARHRGLKRCLIYWLWYKLPARRVQTVVAISEETRRQLIDLAGIRPEKIIVIPDAVSEQFKPYPKPFPERQPTVLHIGTKPNKNLDRVVAALERIDCKLVVIGGLSNTQRSLLDASGVDYE